MGLFLAAVVFLFGREAWAFRLESPAFKTDSPIPQKYTCEGNNISPPLAWFDPPEGTKSFVLISDDTDAPIGTWVHWVAYDFPAEVHELGEAVAKTEVLPDGTKQGKTDFLSVGYDGPCPPPGKPHHYFFKLYALNAGLDLPPKATKADVLVAMIGHVLAQADLAGLYERAHPGPDSSGNG